MLVGIGMTSVLTTHGRTVVLLKDFTFTVYLLVSMCPCVWVQRKQTRTPNPWSCRYRWLGGA